MQEDMMFILEKLKKMGAEYADIRIIDRENQTILTEDLKASDISTNQSRGAGVRVIYKGSLGFAGTNDMDAIEMTAAKAFEAARAGTLLQRNRINLSFKEAVTDTYTTEFEIDPFKVPVKDKLELLFSAERVMRENPGVTRTSGSMEFIRERKFYADSEGSLISQIIYKSGAGIEASSSSDTDTQTRSYPNSFGGNYFTGGYEKILGMKLVENAEKTAQEAVMLAKAEECPSGEYDVIIDPDQLSIQIHESIGHALELDRILGMEAAFAGKSFITTEDIKMDIIYGSENVNVVLDSGITSGLGTFGYDDDGVKAQRAVLIQNGVLKNVLTSRETASHIGEVSNGTSIAEGWGYVPITRITNVNLMPGDLEFDELVSGISKGFYLCTNKSWSIDDKRLNFQFGCEIAYEIENGRLTGKIYKNPVYSGSTLDFWRKCDGICSEKYWRIYGVPNCVKGQPSQVAQVAHGSSPARFRNIRVGVKND